MNSKGIIGTLAAVTLIVLLLASALHWQHVLENGLPPRDATSSTIEEAHQKAQEYARAKSGVVRQVLGTGSMAPYIPAAPPNVAPRSFTAAWVVTAGVTYSDITPGLPCLYAADWASGDIVMHGAAQKDGDGWIMSGLGNARSEPHWRMTAANFRGVARKTFVVKDSQ